MDFIAIGHRPVAAWPERRSSAMRRDVAVHRIEAFEDDQLRAGPDRPRRSRDSRWARSLWRKICFSQPERRIPSIMELWFQASDRIRPRGSRPAIVEIDGKVGDPAGGEGQRRLLAVQVGEFRLELDDRMAVAGDIPRAAGAGAVAGGGLAHRRRRRRDGGPCRDSRSSTRPGRRGSRPSWCQGAGESARRRVRDRRTPCSAALRRRRSSASSKKRR